MDAPAPALPSPPAGLSVSLGTTPGALTIRRRWARPKHVFLVVAIGALDVYLARRWGAVSGGASEVAPFLVIGSLFALSFTARLVAALVNQTTVEVGADAIRVHHGPLPSIVFRPAYVAREAVRDFEARPWGPHYEVLAVGADGARTRLVRPLVTPEQADCVRDALRRAFALQGAAPAEPAGATKAAARGGARLAAMIPAVLVPAILALFFFVASSDVEGSVQIGGAPAGATFTPTDCRSGVPRGFFGVELTSEATPGTIVRVVRDPTRGSMLAVERGGGTPEVFGPDACTTLDLDVEQTSTSINDVWVLRGSARAACEGLAVDVRFDGCH